MLWFNETKNFGFIRTDDGERLYVHRDGFLPDEAPVGNCDRLIVQFEIVGIGEDRRAVGVRPVLDLPQRRARLRHASHSSTR